MLQQTSNLGKKPLEHLGILHSNAMHSVYHDYEKLHSLHFHRTTSVEMIHHSPSLSFNVVVL